ncbi:Hypothetical_protein [Hexamita inflata]|uniref:Hypothetical_protein n=1 Tax=Hexamita inflata TaxID=28002 RepID=A0AA86NWD7_9EUKA|nr:Hypothetical protein HINF_LOCUS14318 [Hexamita inflata]
MVEVVFENFVNYLRSGNTDKLNIISFQQNQQHKINLSTQLIFYRILTKTVVQLKRASNPKILDLLSNCYEHLLTYPQDIIQVPELFEFTTTFIPLKEMLTLAQVGSTYRLQ